MKKIIVASLNPVKAEAVHHGFRRVFPEEEFKIQMVSVSSGVSDQPMTDQDTRIGAQKRAQNAYQAFPGGNLWVGVEGGCDYLDGEMVAFAWIVILSAEKRGSARTALFRLPSEVQRLVESGIELGDADDQIFGRENSKQKSGAVGILTGDVVTRTSLYEQAVILALIPFKNPELY
jgi:inosine/xanthosine triphosphatase